MAKKPTSKENSKKVATVEAITPQCNPECANKCDDDCVSIKEQFDNLSREFATLQKALSDKTDELEGVISNRDFIKTSLGNKHQELENIKSKWYYKWFA